MKKKILYFSPIPPYKSGIADYSETLLTALSERFNITIAIDPMRIVNSGLYNVNERDLLGKFRPDLIEKYEIKYIGWDKVDFDAYDYRIYNVGNNPHFHSYMYDILRYHPGLIILHDVVLHYLTVGRYWGSLPRFFGRCIRWVVSRECYCMSVCWHDVGTPYIVLRISYCP
ncbi:MAG: hypothetical protein IPK68_15350 [Bdellovibrionales bacterium]|nr:hypothetical protein [Bdellovibrionales bacterium]